MAKIRDLIEAVLHRIDEILPEDGVAPNESQDTNILIRYEFEWALQGLRVVLGRILAGEEFPEDAPKPPNPDDEIDDSAIKYFAKTFLSTRWALIKGTDATYNHRPLSICNRAYAILAEELASASNKLHADDIIDGEEPKHAYHYLFSDVDIDSYISSRGKLTDLQLNEFFWSDDFTPIEMLTSLDRYHELCKQDNDTLPVHSCLPEGELEKRRNQQLNHNELSRLLSHSPAAQNYYLAITHAKRTNNWDGVAKMRKELVSQLDSKQSGPFYHYKSSCENLLDKDWLRTVGVFSLYGLAKVLEERVYKQDWKEFLRALEGADKFLLKLLLPSERGMPDESIFKSGFSQKFSEFINNPVYYGNGKESAEHYRVVLYILTELYIYYRSNDAPYTGSVSHLTEGGIGYSRDDKVRAAEKFQEFLQSDKYLNQLQTYLQSTGGTIHYGPLRTGRLLMLTDKAKTFGPSAEDSINSLKSVAEQLIELQKSGWKEFMKEFSDNDLQIYIDSCGGLTACIQSPAHYQEGNDDYNKAVLYILAECYYRQRSNQGVHKGAYSDTISDYTRGMFGGYNKNDKLAAIGVFQEFLASDDYKPNQLDKFLSDTRQKQHEGALRDRFSYGSELKALVAQAEQVCKPEYYHPEQTTNAADKLKQWVPFGWN